MVRQLPLQGNRRTAFGREATSPFSSAPAALHLSEQQRLVSSWHSAAGLGWQQSKG